MTSEQPEWGEEEFGPAGPTVPMAYIVTHTDLRNDRVVAVFTALSLAIRFVGAWRAERRHEDFWMTDDDLYVTEVPLDPTPTSLDLRKDRLGLPGGRDMTPEDV